MAALVHAVGPAPEGSYTINLQTLRRPYILTIRMERLDKPFNAVDFSERATLLLGLVTNLDEVLVTSRNQAYSLSATAASKDLGYDVKQLGRDQGRLKGYMNARSD